MNPTLPAEQNEALLKMLAKGTPASHINPRSVGIGKEKAEREPEKGPNKTEAAFGRHLEWEQQAGRVKWFGFEKIKLRIGKRCWLTIDYIVVTADGAVEFLDVKGRKGDGYYCKDDAKVKLRAVATIFPFAVAVVWPLQGGGWGREEMK